MNKFFFLERNKSETWVLIMRFFFLFAHILNLKYERYKSSNVYNFIQGEREVVEVDSLNFL